MAVRIPGPDDVQQRRIQNERQVVGVNPDPIGRVYESLGERGQAIASRLREQQVESDLLRADLDARSQLDALRREIETGQDPTQYETQFQERAQALLAERGRGMAMDARGYWDRRSAELLTTGTIQTRESAQRRMLDDTRASIRLLSEEADGVIQDPNSDDATRDYAVERVRLAAGKAQARGLLSADDGAAFVTGAEGRLAQVRRTIALDAAALEATDTIFAGSESFQDRLAAARQIENPALRARVEDEVVQRQQRDNAARDESVEAAYGHIAAGERIPPETWDRIPGRDQVRIQDYMRARAEAAANRSELPVDRARVSDLVVMASDQTRQQEFLSLDLQDERPRIGEAAYQRLRVAQDALRNGAPRQGASAETISSALRFGRNQFRAAGLPLNADGNLSAEADEDDAQTMIELQADLIGLVDRFVEENGGRQPSPQEQLVIVQNLMAPRTIERPGMFGIGTRRDTVRAYQSYTPLAQMTPQQRRQAEADVRGAGLPVTRSNIERAHEMRARLRMQNERR